MSEGHSIPLIVDFREEDVPDELFPVYCPACDYRLMHASQGVCPECGLAFQRRELIITQYGLAMESPTFRTTRLDRCRRITRIASVSAFVLWLILKAPILVFRYLKQNEYGESLTGGNASIIATWDLLRPVELYVIAPLLAVLVVSFLVDLNLRDRCSRNNRKKRDALVFMLRANRRGGDGATKA